VAWTWSSKAWNAFCRCVFREPRERAVFEFAWKTLCRSRFHQLYLLGYLGAGLAFLVFGILLLAGVIWLRQQALRSSRSPRSLIFDDAPDPLIQGLNLEY